MSRGVVVLPEGKSKRITQAFFPIIIFSFMHIFAEKLWCVSYVLKPQKSRVASQIIIFWPIWVSKGAKGSYFPIPYFLD